MGRPPLSTEGQAPLNELKSGTCASQEGIPHQTLVSSIIHKYISGSLREVPAARKGLSDK